MSHPRLGLRATCLASSLLLAGCPDDGPATPGDGSTSGTDTGGTTVEGTSSGTTGDETVGPADDTTSTTGEPGVYCETMLCGPADTCCAAGESCVEGQCLAAFDSGIRCGAGLSDCCEDGQICLGGACSDPGSPCVDSWDCPEDQYCDPDLDQCFPSADAAACEVVPEFEDIELALEWSYVEEQIISAPVVGDIDGDSLPEVVINTYFANGSGSSYRAEIIALDGNTGSPQFTVIDDPDNGSYGSYSRVSIAMGDVSGDGRPDIVYAGHPTNDVAPYPDQSSLSTVFATGQCGKRRYREQRVHDDGQPDQ